MDKKKSTILIVDDSSVSRQHLVQILKDDYNVHAVSSGVEAVQIAPAIMPDVILLDIIMPHMDGYETISRLRKGETKDIPVIFITSLDQESDEERGFKLGAAEYISKPYNPAIVKVRIGVILQFFEQMRIIKELSMMDPVTRIPNRKYFDTRLREEWERAKKEGRQLGLLLMDIDKLRTYNAIHSYNQGDAALLAIAEIIEKSSMLSPGDMAARWAFGGFAVLLQHALGGECSQVAESIRSAVEGLTITTPEGKDTNLTISIGANSVSPSDGDCTVEQFIAGADSALYLAKELGRNQVVVNK